MRLRSNCFAFRIYAHLEFVEARSGDFCLNKLFVLSQFMPRAMQIFSSHVGHVECLARKDKDIEKCGIDPDFPLAERTFHTCVKLARACIDIAAAGMNDVKFNAANLSKRTPPPRPRHICARTHAQA